MRNGRVSCWKWLRSAILHQNEETLREKKARIEANAPPEIKAKLEELRDGRKNLTVKSEMARLDREHEAQKQVKIAEFEKNVQDLKKKEKVRRFAILAAINVIIVLLILYRIRQKFLKR